MKSDIHVIYASRALLAKQELASCHQANSDSAIDSCGLELEQNSEEAREWEVLLGQHTAGSAHLPLVEETVRTLLRCLTAY